VGPCRFGPGQADPSFSARPHCGDRGRNGDADAEVRGSRDVTTPGGVKQMCPAQTGPDTSDLGSSGLNRCRAATIRRSACRQQYPRARFSGGRSSLPHQPWCAARHVGRRGTTHGRHSPAQQDDRANHSGQLEGTTGISGSYAEPLEGLQRRPDRHEMIRPTLVSISLLSRRGQACGETEVSGLVWLDVCSKAARTFAVWIVLGRG
jgi:hypothetical protein